MNDRYEMMLENVRYNASVQIDAEHLENYLRSCENHGGELAEIARIVRIAKELDNQTKKQDN